MALNHQVHGNKIDRFEPPGARQQDRWLQLTQHTATKLENQASKFKPQGEKRPDCDPKRIE
jgi:hypothetical protein